MAVPDLVVLFTALGIGQFQAELHGGTAKENALIFKMRDVIEELKRRPGDQRSALLPLLNHENIQVRLMAAKLTLAVAPAAASHALQSIRESNEQPQAMDAGMCLWNLETGVFKPT